MNNLNLVQGLVYKSQQGTPVTDSLKVAEAFGKEHRNVLKIIHNLLGPTPNLAHANWFSESTYLNSQDKEQPMYIINRDGFSLLAMGFTGAKAMQIKIGFIEQFAIHWDQRKISPIAKCSMN